MFKASPPNTGEWAQGTPEKDTEDTPVGFTEREKGLWAENQALRAENAQLQTIIYGQLHQRCADIFQTFTNRAFEPQGADMLGGVKQRTEAIEFQFFFLIVILSLFLGTDGDVERDCEVIEKADGYGNAVCELSCDDASARHMKKSRRFYGSYTSPDNGPRTQELGVGAVSNSK